MGGVTCAPYAPHKIDSCSLIIISPKDAEEIIKEVQGDGLDWITYEDLCFLRYSYPDKVEDSDFKRARPFNWYESPFPDIRRVHEIEDMIFKHRPTLA